MSLLDKNFIITESRKCPLYRVNDKFELSGLAVTPPPNKPVCVFLIRVIAEKYIADMSSASSAKHDTAEFNCPGCSGLVKVTFAGGEKYHTLHMRLMMAAERRKKTGEIGALAGMLSSFSFFQALDEKSLKAIISHLAVRSFESGEIILHKGAPGKNLYIIASGRAALLNPEEVQFASLGRGELFGEMSILNDQPVSATVKALEPMKTFLLPKKDLQQLMLQYPFLWSAFHRILVQRLINTSDTRGSESVSGISGRLEEICTAELFQMIHENSKTGCCTLELPGGRASVIFVNGEVIYAACQEKSREEAFFAILRAQKGLFQFTSTLPVKCTAMQPIDRFNKLLMEGLRRIDEE